VVRSAASQRSGNVLLGKRQCMHLLHMHVTVYLCALKLNLLSSVKSGY